MRINTVTSCFVFLIALIVGCGESGVPTYAISGHITYKGKPVEGGIIGFSPVGGETPIGGPFRNDGSYDIRVPAGEYHVRISTPLIMPEGWKEGDSMRGVRPRIPPRYGMPKSSGLTATVRADGENTFDFPLK